MMLHPSHAILSSQNGTGLSRRALNIGAVALLHMGLIWGVAHSMSSGAIENFLRPIDTKVIEDQKLPAEAPLPKPVIADPTKVTYVPPVIEFAPETSDRVITVPPYTETTALVVNKVPDTGPLAANARTIPPYPPLAERIGSEGTVTLHLTISETGAVKAADLVKSSGSGELDRTAISWVIAHWKYKPAIRGGQRVASATDVSMTFTLTGRR